MDRGKLTKDLIDAAIGAKAHFDVWWTLESEGRLRFKQSITDHSEYFGAAQDAHYVAFFVYFAQLFDKRRDASSIKAYLKLIKADIEPEQHAKLCRGHNCLNHRAQPLLTIRHNLVAHTNAMLSEENVFSTLDTTWFAMRDTIYKTSIFVANIIGVSDPGQIGIPRVGRLNEATIKLLQSLGEESDA